MELIKNIEKLKEELAKETSKEDLKRKLTEIEQRIKKREEEIKTRKQRKFIRDQNDYASGRVLTFSKKYDHLYKNNEQPLNGSKTVEPDREELLSICSICESDISTDEVTPVVPTTGKKPNHFLEDFRVLAEFRNQQIKQREYEGGG